MMTKCGINLKLNCSHVYCFFLLELLTLFSIIYGFRINANAGAPEASRTRPLYGDDSAVINLNASTFESVVFGENRASLVEFYSSWCGHCVNFAPKFERFAEDVKPWSSVVAVAGVNCADDFNTALCRVQQVDSYPSLKYYQYPSSGINGSHPLENHHQQPDQMRKLLALEVADDARRDIAERKWPNFKPISESETLQDIFTSAKSVDAKNVALIAVGSENITAIEVILDFSQIQDISIRQISIDHQISKVNDLVNPPGLLFFALGNAIPKRIASIRNRQEITRLIRSELNLPSKNAKDNTNAPVLPIPAIDDKKTNGDIIAKDEGSTTPVVHMSDLLGGFSYLLGHEVALKQTVNQTALKALHDFLDVCGQYFPGKPPVVDLLNRMVVFLQQQKGTLSGDQWKKQYDLVQTEHGHPLPANPNWVACRGSEDRFRGYPCSLWLLFHTITIHAYKISGLDPTFLPATVLQAFRGYILNFFGCHECAENFSKESTRINEEVKHPYDVVLWLWRLHNRVNARLHSTKDEDPSHPKLQFPSTRQCQQCRDSDGSINEPMVLEYLVQVYGAEAIPVTVEKMDYKVSKFVKGEMKHEKSESLDLNAGNGGFHAVGGSLLVDNRDSNESISRTGSKSGGFFSKIDFSLCFMLWAGSIVLVGVMFSVLRHRKNRHKLYKKLRGDRNV